MADLKFITTFLANTSQAKKEVAQLSAAISTVGTSFSSMVGFVSGAAKAIAISFAGVTGAALASALVVNQFNQNLVNAAALGDLTGSQMNRLGQQIVGLSVKYGQSASAIADGAVVLTKAGLTAEEVAMSMDSITQAMLANGIAFEEAANIAVYATKQFGGTEGFSNLTELMDKMQKITQETILDFGELQEGLQYAGSTAMLAGVPFDNLLAMLGTLSQRAMQAGIAARSLNQMMLNLVDSAPEMQAWMDAMGMGISVFTEEGDLNVDEIVRAFSELEYTIEDLQKAGTIFTDRALRSWGLLITGAEEYTSLLDQVSNASGTLEQVYKRQTESIQFQFSRLKATLAAGFLTPEFAEAFKTLLENAAPKIEKLAQVLAGAFFQFLQWTVENGPRMIDFLTSFVENLFTMIKPLYEIATVISPKMLDFLFKAYIGFKLLSKAAPIEALKTTFQLVMQESMALERVTQAEMRHEAAIRRKASARVLQNAALAVTNAREQANISTMTKFGIAANQIGVAMATAAASALYMGAAFGESARMIAYATIMITAFQTAAQAALIAPPGFKIAGALATGLGTFALGASMFEVGAKYLYKKPSMELSNYDLGIPNSELSASPSIYSPSTGGTQYNTNNTYVIENLFTDKNNFASWKKEADNNDMWGIRTGG